ncbi:ABC transporter permease [candidate division KSB1 bacterium]
MSNVLAIYKREIKSFFVSPIAYGVIAGFLVMSGFFFYITLTQFLDVTYRSTMEAQAAQQLPPPLNVNVMVIPSLFTYFAMIILLMNSLITMKLFAEEKKMMTIELLFTSPITSLQTVLGKFFAGFTLFMIMLLPTISYFLIMDIYGDPELTPIFTGYIGLILLGGVFIAIGIMASSLTENQLVSVAISLSISVLFWISSWPVNLMGTSFLSSIFNYLSLQNHLIDFIGGIINTRDIIYFVSLIVFAIYITYRSLESMRWRS